MKALRKLIIFINDPVQFFLLSIRIFMLFPGIRELIPEGFFIKYEYRLRMGKKLNLNNPETFNEKLQWLKINDKNPLYTNLTDKLAVRQFIGEKIGRQYLIPLLGVYDRVEEIPFNCLPEQYVLKCTHDSGTAIIKNTSCELSVEDIKKKLRKALKRNYYYVHREWPYKNIKPRIICEQYMVDESGLELKDYKFLCFNGQPKCLFVCLNRHSSTGLNVDFYDINWDAMPFERHYPRSGTIIPKPKTFNKMIEFAKILSKDIPFVRVDFYDVHGKLYVGELTLYPGSGYEEFTPESFDYLLGSWLKLPNRS